MMILGIELLRTAQEGKIIGGFGPAEKPACRVAQELGSAMTMPARERWRFSRQFGDRKEAGGKAVREMPDIPPAVIGTSVA
jgi:hypothetical protein